MGILFSTVFLRFRYVIDLLASILLALNTTWLAPRFGNAWERWLARWRGAAPDAQVALAQTKTPGQSSQVEGGPMVFHLLSDSQQRL